ncbi:Oxoglutarate/iron-dependent dioxygenase [Penicillium angulare]|uniref:Oxoglutarate/iron-dependent dioxygenase n=1 Tax=Penicillium angulare TaxID=116970 RepID=A0A9W9FU84_9EURO|nr:Oxoglutarate/iron-dependent dioxygenase [Penicillium angulare]
MSYDLDAARIAPLSGDAFYISDFISEDEEALLMQKVQSVPLPRWTHLSHRRLQTWPSALTKSNTLLSSPLPSWLTNPIIHRFKELGVFANAPHTTPNHVLVNEYQPGQGIMPHEDGAAYYPLVATVSLGAPIVLDIYEKDSHQLDAGADDSHGKPRFRILQERRSLLVMRGKLYTDFLHGIAESTRDEDLGPHSICNWDLLGEKAPYEGGWVVRETRTSLTYRDVLKVAKMGNTLKFLGGAK